MNEIENLFFNSPQKKVKRPRSETDSSLMDSLETSLFTDNDAATRIKNYGFYPYSTPRRIWEFIMFFLSIFVLWEISFEWFFNLEHTFVDLIPLIIIDIFYFFDIFIVEHTGIMCNGVIKLDKESIFERIPLWRRIIYWISPWPYYLIGYFCNSHLTYNILLFLKCIRFFRLYDAQNVIKNTLIYINPISKMSRLLAVLLTVVHFCACVFWYTGHSELPNKSWLLTAQIAHKPKLIQYFHTIYYITTTMLTIGYGDLHPVTFPEVCVVICVEAFGVFCYQFVSSNLVSIVADPSRNSFISKYERVFSAFKSRNISPEALSELLTYYEYVWERDRDHTSFYDTASVMPEGLQKRIALALHTNLFAKVNSLRNASEEVLENIAIALRPRIFIPGDYIIKAKKISNKMYFITEGKVSIVSPTGGVICRIDGHKGSVLGEESMINRVEEPNSAIAVTYVEAFELLKEDFDDIVHEHPMFQDRLIPKTLIIPKPHLDTT